MTQTLPSRRRLQEGATGRGQGACATKRSTLSGSRQVPLQSWRLVTNSPHNLPRSSCDKMARCKSHPETLHLGNTDPFLRSLYRSAVPTLCVRTTSNGALNPRKKSALLPGDCKHPNVPLREGLKSDPLVSVGEAVGPGLLLGEGRKALFIGWCNQTFNYGGFSEAIDAKKRR